MDVSSRGGGDRRGGWRRRDLLAGTVAVAGLAALASEGRTSTAVGQSRAQGRKVDDMGAARACFAAGDAGEWEIIRIESVRGVGLAPARRLAHVEGVAASSASPPVAWALEGVRSNERYLEAAEKRRLVSVQAGLGRSEATLATLIPITKSAAWWALAQDERRAIFEARSQHIAIGMEYLPAVARRLYHGRDLGAEFDFLTWFEYAPEAAPGFAELLRRLRATPEWEYVEREVEVHVRRVT